MKRTPLKRTGFKKKARKPIAKRRARYTPGFWAGQKRRLRELQHGRCAACEVFLGRAMPNPLDAAHIQGLGAGSSRDNPDDPRNAIENLVGLCRRHHEWFDAQPWERRMHDGPKLKKSLADLLAREDQRASRTTPRTTPARFRDETGAGGPGLP